MKLVLLPKPLLNYPLRCVPDRRGVGPLLVDQFRFLRNLRTQANLVIEHPARCRNLKDPGVVEGLYVRIEIGIGPDRDEFRGAYGVGPVRGLQVDGVADRRFTPAVLADLAAVLDCHVVDLLVGLAFLIEPALDDLDAVEVGADGVAQGIDHER